MTAPRFTPDKMIEGLTQEALVSACRFIDSITVLDRYAARFPRAFDVFYYCGIHPTRPRVVPNPFGEKAESFSNIGVHGLAVGICAERIAQHMRGFGIVSAEECDQIIERALTHDLAKPFELYRQRAFLKGKADTREAELVDIRFGLAEFGADEELIRYVYEAGYEAGGYGIPLLLRSSGGEPYLVTGHYVEKIVRLADSMTFTPLGPAGIPPRSAFLTCAERMVAGQNYVRYAHMRTDRLFELPDSSVIILMDTETPPADAIVLGEVLWGEIFTTHLLAKELAGLCGVPEECDPDKYFKDLVNGGR